MTLHWIALGTLAALLALPADVSGQASARSCSAKTNKADIEFQNGLTTQTGKRLHPDFDCWMPKHDDVRRELCAENPPGSGPLDFEIVLRNSCRASVAGRKIEVVVRAKFYPGDLEFDSGDCGSGLVPITMRGGPITLSDPPVKLACRTKSYIYDSTKGKSASYTLKAERILEKRADGTVRRSRNIDVEYDPQIAVERAGDPGGLGKPPDF